MKVIVLRNNLKEALDALSRIINEGATLAVLKYILIKTDTNKISFFSTNLEVAIVKEIPGKVIESGEVVLPFGVLYSIVNNIQNERIDLESQKTNLTLKTDNYEAVIQGIASHEFPIVPKIKDEKHFLEIQSPLLKEAINKVINASQISELRPELSGVLINIEPAALRLAATDSFRLAEKTVPSSQVKNTFQSGVKAIIPLKTAQEASRNLGNDSMTKVFIDEAQVLFKTEGLEIVSRLIDGQFPDYEPIIPKELETEIILDRNELVSALKLTSSFSSRNSEVVIKLKEGKKVLEIYSADNALGENKYLIPVKAKGEEVSVSFNWKFLLDGLKNISSETIVLGLQGDSRPAIVKSPNDASYFYVLMPIKNS